MKNSNEFLRNQPAGPIDDGPRTAEAPVHGQVISLPDRQRINVENEGSLLSDRQTEDLRDQWKTVQGSFVDEPRKAVQDADQLVSSAIQQLSERFRGQRENLEKQWSSGGDVSTEDLRVCLQRYRDFFHLVIST